MALPSPVTWDRTGAKNETGSNAGMRDALDDPTLPHGRRPRFGPTGRGPACRRPSDQAPTWASMAGSGPSPSIRGGVSCGARPRRTVGTTG